MNYSIEVPKKRIVAAYHMNMPKDKDCPCRSEDKGMINMMTFLLMEIKLEDGKTIYVRQFENYATYQIETWFNRIKEMKPNDTITIVIYESGKGLFKMLGGSCHRLFNFGFLSASMD